jgi:hypothetical protein
MTHGSRALEHIGRRIRPRMSKPRSRFVRRAQPNLHRSHRLEAVRQRGADWDFCVGSLADDFVPPAPPMIPDERAVPPPGSPALTRKDSGWGRSSSMNARKFWASRSVKWNTALTLPLLPVTVRSCSPEYATCVSNPVLFKLTGVNSTSFTMTGVLKFLEPFRGPGALLFRACNKTPIGTRLGLVATSRLLRSEQSSLVC